MHYCFFTSGSLQSNGTLLRVRDLGAALADLGVEVSYLLDRFDFNENKLSLHPAAKKIFVDGKSAGERAARRRGVISAHAPDYIHVLAPGLASFVSLFGVKARIVGDWDEWPARRHYLSWRFRKLHATIDYWLRRRCVLRVVASRHMQRAFEEDFGYTSLYLPHASFLGDYPEPTSPFLAPTAVYMGNFFPAYDHDVLFLAAEIMKNRGFMPPMEIIGSGPDFEYWKSWAVERGLSNVSLPGYLVDAELWSHLRCAKVCLFPIRDREVNLYRCPGKTFMYAHARRPIIASPVGEVAELLKDKAIYASATPEAFADRIELVMREPTMPDIEFDVGTWNDRARQLLDALKA